MRYIGNLLSSPFPYLIPHPTFLQFIIICCDGVWDMLDNQACVRYVRTRLQAGMDDLTEIGKGLLDHCLETGNRDNMTCVIVLLEAGEKLIPTKQGCKVS